jgi:hypothetical protein
MRKMLAVSLIAILSLGVAGAVLADPPGGKGRGHGRGGGGVEAEPVAAVTIQFGDDHRRAVNEYYGSYSGRSCPPGLAKKNNGCMPPGQAKKWAMNRPLPPDVIYYEVPRDLVVRLPPIPINQRYVRVAGDILLIAAGTGMVMGAIEDLGRL